MYHSLHFTHSPRFHGQLRTLKCSPCHVPQTYITRSRTPREATTLILGKEQGWSGAEAGRSPGQDPRRRTRASRVLRATGRALLAGV